MADSSSIGSGPPIYPGTLTASSDSMLPSYSPRLRDQPSQSTPRPRPLVHHKFELSTGNGRAWATLNVQSRAQSPQSMPTFAEGDTVNGSVVLDLKKQENIKRIYLVLQGQVMMSPINFWKFFETKHVLWERSNSHDKVTGRREWPFSLAIPRTISVDHTDITEAGLFRLPQTFLEKAIQTSIQYDLFLHMKRAGLVQSSSRIQTMLAYVPITRPGPSSQLRSLAYQEHSPLLGPEADPEGWHSMPPCSINGTLFSNHQVNVNMNLYLAKPLAYTRGTTVPCLLIIGSPDNQALDLLSTDAGIPIRLRRYVTAYNKAADGYGFGVGNNPKNQGAGSSSRSRFYDSTTRWIDAVEDLSNGVWWASQESQRAPGTRRLNGEIKLARSLKPSCRIGSYRIKYTIVLLPFATTGFSRDSTSATAPLLEVEVEIATTFAPGPRPISYAPAASADPRTTGGDNYIIPPASFYL